MIATSPSTSNSTWSNCIARPPSIVAAALSR
jgi:hypothetical protein